MSYDAGFHGLAQRYFIQALKLADFADNQLLGGSILDAMSHQATYLGRSADAASLARAARSGTRGIATAGVTAHLHAMEARALGGSGQCGLVVLGWLRGPARSPRGGGCLVARRVGVLPVESDIDICRAVFYVLTGPCSTPATRPLRVYGRRQPTDAAGELPGRTFSAQDSRWSGWSSRGPPRRLGTSIHTDSTTHRPPLLSGGSITSSLAVRRRSRGRRAAPPRTVGRSETSADPHPRDRPRDHQPLDFRGAFEDGVDLRPRSPCFCAPHPQWRFDLRFTSQDLSPLTIASQRPTEL